MKEKYEDITCLAENMIFPADMKKTGINLNELVVGSTGSGKTFSTAYPRIMHTYNSSVVVPIAKRDLMNRFASLFEKRGYKVMVLDFVSPDKSTIGYDPLDRVRTDLDVVRLAEAIADKKSYEGSKADPFWEQSSTSLIASLINLVILNARISGTRPSLRDVINVFHTIEFNYDGESMKTNFDDIFERLEENFPGNQAGIQWQTFHEAAQRTSKSIYVSLNTVVDKVINESILALAAEEERVDFEKLGRERTALFVITSPMDSAMQNYINIFYSDLFSSMFFEAEANGGSLGIPVHIICDDFACSGRIPDFEKYISVFRAAGISVTLLLQSESQLESMYGQSNATTIINNCDTYVYMGGLDIKTCDNIAKKMNKQFSTVFSMPLENVIVIRRGAKPVMARRYQTLEDEVYRSLYTEENKEEKYAEHEQ